jgi:ParB-like chromosome segregation protein Spo0J
MSDRLFQLLRQQIREKGFRASILATKDFVIIDGEHRWKALKEEGATQITALLVDEDEIEAMLSTVNMNIIKGILNPIKYGKLITRSMERYSPKDLDAKLATDPAERELLAKMASKIPDVNPNDLRDSLKSREWTLILHFNDETEFTTVRAALDTIKSDCSFERNEDAAVYMAEEYIRLKANEGLKK